MADKKFILDDLVEKEIKKMVEENTDKGIDLNKINLDDPNSIDSAINKYFESKKNKQKIYTKSDIDSLEKEINEYKETLLKKENISEVDLNKLKLDLKRLETIKDFVENQRKLTCVYVGVNEIAKAITRKDFENIDDNEFGEVIKLILKSLHSTNRSSKNSNTETITKNTGSKKESVNFEELAKKLDEKTKSDTEEDNICAVLNNINKIIEDIINDI